MKKHTTYNDRLFIAIENDDTDTVIDFFNNKKEYIPYYYESHQEISHYGTTPTALAYACSLNKIEIVKLLLNMNIDLNYFDNYDEAEMAEGTCMHYACKYGHYDIVRLLLNHPDIDPQIVFSNMTPLHIACKYGHLDIVKMLCSDERVDVNINVAPDHLKFNTPLYVACRHKQLEIVKYLLQHPDIDPSITGDDGTVLSIACLISDKNDEKYELIKLLLEDGRVDPNIKHPTSGNSPLSYACYRNDINTVRILLERPNIDTFGALVSACYGCISVDTTDVIKILLEYNNLNYDFNNESPLHALASITKNTNTDIINISRMLIEDPRIDPNAVNYRHETPLFVACNENNIKMVKLLLDPIYNIDVNIPDAYGKTPFYNACKNNHINIVKMLYENNSVDVTKTDNNGKSPFEAICDDRTDLIKLMIEHNNI